MPSGEGPSEADGTSSESAQGGTPGVQQDAASTDTTTYDTAADYIAHLNEDITWLEYDESAGTSTPAPNWRIRTGITQGDTSLCTEINLALAAAAQVGAEHVDFATVWGLGHTTAEVTGDSTTNFIEWVTGCCVG